MIDQPKLSTCIQMYDQSPPLPVSIQKLSLIPRNSPLSAKDSIPIIAACFVSNLPASISVAVPSALAWTVYLMHLKAILFRYFEIDLSSISFQPCSIQLNSIQIHVHGFVWCLTICTGVFSKTILIQWITLFIKQCTYEIVMYHKFTKYCDNSNNIVFSI